jgi:hypothetical protein
MESRWRAKSGLGLRRLGLRQKKVVIQEEVHQREQVQPHNQNAP